MYKPSDDRNSNIRIFRLVGLYVLAVMISIILLVFAELREDPQFWRTEGDFRDFPFWLRDLVLDTFYPLLAFQFIVLGAVSIFQLLALPGSRKHRICLLALPILLWIIFGGVIVFLSANNVENVFDGRDLHYHPPFQSR